MPTRLRQARSALRCQLLSASACHATLTCQLQQLVRAFYALSAATTSAVLSSILAKSSMDIKGLGSSGLTGAAAALSAFFAWLRFCRLLP
ncbi:MAG: hypothetical protein MZU97_27030 [Bacillus subtilis]|nr:hypothetical protein [Bacillus subtilis]